VRSHDRWVDRVQAPPDLAPSLTVGTPVENGRHGGDEESQYQILGTESPFALIGNGQQGGDE
jgi:hypothetical protein